MQKSKWAPKAESEEVQKPSTTPLASTSEKTDARQPPAVVAAVDAIPQQQPEPQPPTYTAPVSIRRTSHAKASPIPFLELGDLVIPICYPCLTTYVQAFDNVAYDPAYDDPSIDPFAQTAGTDDLFFDDDITPIAEPVVEQNPPEVEPTEPESVPDEAPPPPTAPQATLAPHTPREPRNADRGNRGRGRGRGGRGRGRGGHVGDIRETEKKPKEGESKPAEQTTAASEHPADPKESTEAPAAPSAPTEPKEKPTHSVRGDRTLTGGLARTRLTEEQLNAKLASMRSKNEALQTAHARAEADQANFEAREAVLKKQDVERKKLLAEKQKAERQNRQQMMGEREKNRLRKLNAQGGREWDFEKEEGFSGTGEERRRGAVRGAHGGIAPSRGVDDNQHTRSLEESEDTGSMSNHRGRGRGRGGRGSRGGRGDHDGSRTQANKAREQQKPPSAADFPDLPTPTTSSQDAPKKTLDFPIKAKGAEAAQSTSAETERPGIKKQESFGIPSPMEKGSSWADEVA